MEGDEEREREREGGERKIERDDFDILTFERWLSKTIF